MSKYDFRPMKTDITFFSETCRKKDVRSQHVIKMDSKMEFRLEMIEGVFPIFSRNAFLDLSNAKTQNA